MTRPAEPVPQGGRPARPTRHAVVESTEWLTDEMVRVWLTGEGVDALPPLEHTDHYVKLLFPPTGGAYPEHVDAAGLKEALPREEWPVTRTYTIRSLEAGRMAVDFVHHGEDGLAGPWAAAARPGDPISFHGPGGAWSPTPGAHHLLAGDESALPALAAAMERLLEVGGTAQVLCEVGAPDLLPELPTGPGLEVVPVLRGAHGHGQALAHAVVEQGELPGGVQVFVHGVAEMVKDVRRFLFVERGLPREQVSISGYWRTGCTEDEWQAGKRDFVAAMEAAERAG